MAHAVYYRHSNSWNGSRWEFDGNFDQPTVNPSLLVDLGDGRKCHSFLRQGQIQFLSDSYHAFAGTIIEIPDWPWVD